MVLSVYSITYLMQNQLSFKARVIKGEGKGKKLGFPTINLSLSDVPRELEYGVYAAYITIGDEKHKAAMQYGKRPVLDLPKSCELHVVDGDPGEVSEEVEVEVVERLRGIEKFESEEELKKQIGKDVNETRKVLKD